MAGEWDRLSEKVGQLEKIVRERDDIIGNNADRITRLEELVKAQAKEIDDYGVTIDHLCNTQDSILLPTQKQHSEKHMQTDILTKESHDYIWEQKGAWAFVQRFGIVIGALSSLVLLCLKLWGKP
jgi:hypothetical protein